MSDAIRPWFNYVIRSYKVTDGDTVKVVLDLGFHLDYRVRLRIAGVDTPEIRLLATRKAGEHATRAVTHWMDCFTIRQGYQLIVQSSVLEAKYHNRILGDIIAWQFAGPWFSLSDYLLRNGLARVYVGGRRALWSKEELDAILAVAVDHATISRKSLAEANTGEPADVQAYCSFSRDPTA